jgi:hypothetical protein
MSRFACLVPFPLRDAQRTSFSLVSGTVLHYNKDHIFSPPTTALREIRRYQKPTGVLLLY